MRSHFESILRRPLAAAWRSLLLVAVSVLSLAYPPYVANAQSPGPNDLLVMRASGSARLGGTLRVWMHVPTGGKLPDRPVLHLNGYPVPGLPVLAVEPTHIDAAGGRRGTVQAVEFTLVRNAESAMAWRRLLGSPNSTRLRFDVSVGAENQRPYRAAAGAKTVTEFAVVRRGWLETAFATVAALIALMGWLAVRTNMLRDPAAGTDSSQERPYSLAKLVMFLWFAVISVSYVGLWIVSGDHSGIITQQSLLLLGITAGVGAVSVTGTRNATNALTRQLTSLESEHKTLDAQVHAAPALDSDKSALVPIQERLIAVNLERERLRAMQPRHLGWLTDLMGGATGPDFHRVQNLAWNVILGLVFLGSVFETLAFPTFDANQLLLLGISQTLYLGVKLQEPLKGSGEEAQDSAQRTPTSSPAIMDTSRIQAIVRELRSRLPAALR